jgi:hypothetical protein
MASDLRVIAAPVAGSTQSGACCASVQTNDYPLPDSAVADPLLGQAAGPTGQQVTPGLARPQPTGSPRPTSSSGQEAKAASDRRAPAGGLVVAGMGLGTLAGLLAWFGRRRAPHDDDEGGPRLSVLRMEGNDARNERRILPPT